MKKEKINIGVIGFGRIGKMHVKNLHENLPMFNLKTITDPGLDLKSNKNLGNINYSHSVDDIISDKTIEAVVICSPTPTHFELIKKCAASKKNIFCEKPISFSENEIQEIIKIMNDQKIFLQVGLNRRFDQDFVLAKEKVDAGMVGDVHTIHITNHDASIPSFKFLKSSGGMLFDLCIHDFDMLNFITGSQIKEIYVKGGVFIEPKLKDIGDIDNVLITIELENGVLCSIDSSRQTHYGYDQRIEIFGSRGLLAVENKSDSLYHFSNDKNTKTSKINYSFIERYKESYVSELEYFYKCIISNTKPTVGPENILSAIKVASAGVKSLNSNIPQRVKK